jgi:peptidyl-dipeptidase A
MCTSINQEDFTTVHHEMGHIQYYMIFRNQSFLFRDGANKGFDEGVADILSLNVGTASYTQKLGLLSKDIDITDEQTNVNILFSMALERVAFMPWGYLVDKYRWDLYSGMVGEDDMNCHWVKLRAEIQGVMPPNMRSENHFDAGAKYHVASDGGYVRYFTAFVYEFQFYRALCLVAKQYDPNDPSKPLHQCNLFGKFFFLIAGV